MTAEELGKRFEEMRGANDDLKERSLAFKSYLKEASDRHRFSFVVIDDSTKRVFAAATKFSAPLSFGHSKDGTLVLFCGAGGTAVATHWPLNEREVRQCAEQGAAARRRSLDVRERRTAGRTERDDVEASIVEASIAEEGASIVEEGASIVEEGARTAVEETRTPCSRQKSGGWIRARRCRWISITTTRLSSRTYRWDGSCTDTRTCNRMNSLRFGTAPKVTARVCRREPSTAVTTTRRIRCPIADGVAWTSPRATPPRDERA